MPATEASGLSTTQQRQIFTPRQRGDSGTAAAWQIVKNHNEKLGRGGKYTLAKIIDILVARGYARGTAQNLAFRMTDPGPERGGERTLRMHTMRLTAADANELQPVKSTRGKPAIPEAFLAVSPEVKKAVSKRNSRGKGWHRKPVPVVEDAFFGGLVKLLSDPKESFSFTEAVKIDGLSTAEARTMLKVWTVKSTRGRYTLTSDGRMRWHLKAQPTPEQIMAEAAPDLEIKSKSPIPDEGITIKPSPEKGDGGGGPEDIYAKIRAMSEADRLEFFQTALYTTLDYTAEKMGLDKDAAFYAVAGGHLAALLRDHPELKDKIHSLVFGKTEPSGDKMVSTLIRIYENEVKHSERMLTAMLAATQSKGDLLGLGTVGLGLVTFFVGILTGHYVFHV